MKNFRPLALIILTIVNTFSLFGQTQPTPTPPTPAEQELIDLINKLNEAEMKDDNATADSIKTEQHLAVYGGIGNLMIANKEKLAEFSKAAAARTNEQNRRIAMEFSDFKVNILGDYAVVLAKEVVTQKVNNRIVIFPSQFTYFLAKKDGKWKVVAWQVVSINYGSFPKSEQIIFDVLPISEKVKSFTWNKIAEDKQGDGMRPTSADGRALSYFYEKETDMLWFKFELYNAIETEKPAVSLAIDVDADQNTGTNWWGTISTFKYDKVLNLGISEKILETKVKGYNGITSNKAAIYQNWLNEKKNNLMFHLNKSENAYYLGVKRIDISPTAKKINIVGSVGANSQWNDDIGEGFAPIEIPFGER